MEVYFTNGIPSEKSPTFQGAPMTSSGGLSLRRQRVQKVCKQGSTLGSTKWRLHRAQRSRPSAAGSPDPGAPTDFLLTEPPSSPCRLREKLPKMYDTWSTSISDYDFATSTRQPHPQLCRSANAKLSSGTSGSHGGLRVRTMPRSTAYYWV